MDYVQDFCWNKGVPKMEGILKLFGKYMNIDVFSNGRGSVSVRFGFLTLKPNQTKPNQLFIIKTKPNHLKISKPFKPNRLELNHLNQTT